MGKSQKKRQMRRHNPVRVPDSHLPAGLASASASSSKSEAILPIIQKMESADATERKWACVAVSNLIQNDPSTRRLLQGKNVVGALITRLSDSEEEVVIEAGGALRNLCIDGGYDICAEMYNKNILAPLKTFIPKISTTLTEFLQNPKAASDNAQKLVHEFADSIITILWCLSETSNKALNAINLISLVPFLMSFLGSKHQLPISTVTSAAQCLYVLTDDNYPAVEEVRSNGAFTACLLSIIGGNGQLTKGKDKAKAMEGDRETTLRVLCSGILRNISPVPPPSIAATIDVDNDVVLPTLKPVLSSISLSELTRNALELSAQEDAIPEIQKLSLKNSPKNDHKSANELELERLERRLRAVQLALEILTGVCARLPDPQPIDDGEEAREGDVEDDDMGEDDTDMADETEATNHTQVSASIHLPEIVTPLLDLIQPTSLSFPPVIGGPSPHPPITSALSAIHICALECLNNIFLSLSDLAQSRETRVTTPALDIAAGTRVWTEIWNALAATGTNIDGPGQEKRKEMWFIGVGVLWGIAAGWKGYLEPNLEQLKILTQLCSAAPDEGVKVKCIGTLECLAQYPHSIEANLFISQYLFSLIPSASNPISTPTEPLIQAVSAIIDIYSDETLPYDVNFRQNGYLDLLVSSVENVRKTVRGIDRKRERDLRRRGEEVRDNLVAFIGYRRGLDL